jgi:hypothetical protein
MRDRETILSHEDAKGITDKILVRLLREMNRSHIPS